ncbi:MAG: DNA repair protein RecO [Chloroflexi bacterium]|nr:DNA repair protein RecO [Chloroflexota bacterium]
MPRPRTYKTEAIVLKAARLGEADRLLTMFTPSLGKVRAVARGALRPKSKLAGHLEPFTRASLMLAQGRTLDVVAGAQALEAFPTLRADLERTGLAFYLAELVDRFTAEGQESYPIYALLLEALGWLDKAQKVGLARPAFELQVLRLSGHGPQLSHCLKCRAEIKGAAAFSSASGGALCPICERDAPDARPLSIAARRAMVYLQGSAFSRGARVKVPTAVEREMEGLLQGYIAYVLEQSVKSAIFLERLRREDVSAAAAPNSRPYPEGPA